jgi:hypothetical protein
MLPLWKGADMSELRVGDRATLRAWRIVNVLGWSIAATIGSLVLRLGAESAAGLWGIGFGEVATTADGWKYLLIVAIPAAILVGVFVGYVAWTRVVRHPAATAAVLTVLFASGAAWLFWESFRYANVIGFLIGLMISGYLSVPAAVLMGRVLGRGRAPLGRGR